MERSAETTRDDPDGEYLKRNRWFESGSLQRRVYRKPEFSGGTLGARRGALERGMSSGVRAVLKPNFDHVFH